LRAFGEQGLDLGGESPAGFLSGMHLPDLPRPDLPAAIYEIDGRPILVAKGLPIGVVRVEKMGVCQLVLAHGVCNGFGVALKVELGAVHADALKATIRKTSVDVPDPGHGADAIDSAERPDVKNDDTPSEGGPGERGPDPVFRPRGGKRRCLLGTASARRCRQPSDQKTERNPSCQEPHDVSIARPGFPGGWSGVSGVKGRWLGGTPWCSILRSGPRFYLSDENHPIGTMKTP